MQIFECLLCNFDWLCLASNQISSFAKLVLIFSLTNWWQISRWKCLRVSFYNIPSELSRGLIESVHLTMIVKLMMNITFYEHLANGYHYHRHQHHHLANDYAQPRTDHQDHQEVNNNHSCQWSDLRQNTPNLNQSEYYVVSQKSNI